MQIYQAMLLKDSFTEFYNLSNINEGKKFLEKWIEDAESSGLKTFIKLAQSFKNKSQYLLNWFETKKCSAISEGFNNKIKRLKRMAYGYRDVDYFCLKIHQHCGYLHPKYFEPEPLNSQKIKQVPLS
jgi:transposase